jgi:pheromone a factor receptor
MFMVWTVLVLLINFVSAIVWDGNSINWAPVWCDIVIRIQIASMVAWPACVLCIVRRLYFIAATTTVTATHTDKRRQLVVDLLITVGAPLLFSLMQLISAGHRGDIFENYGCQPATYNTPVAFVLTWIWPLIISLVSATYGLFTVRAFMKRRQQFKDLVASTGMTWNRYWRLIMLAFADLFFTTPLTVWGVVNSAALVPISPWISWADTHAGYDRFNQYPWVVVKLSPVLVSQLEINRWSAVLCALIFFGFFGFADEAKKNYRLFVSTVSKRLGGTTFSQSTAISDSIVKSGAGSKGGAVYITKHVESKRDSFDSFSDRLSASITVGEYELKVQPYSPTEQSTSSSSSSVISPDEVPQVPRYVIDTASARKPSVPDAPKSVHPDNAFDQV